MVFLIQLRISSGRHYGCLDLKVYRGNHEACERAKQAVRARTLVINYPFSRIVFPLCGIGRRVVSFSILSRTFFPPAIYDSSRIQITARVSRCARHSWSPLDRSVLKSIWYAVGRVWHKRLHPPPPLGSTIHFHLRYSRIIFIEPRDRRTVCLLVVSYFISEG